MLQRSLRPISQSFFLFGPRGTGKSTWIRQNFPNATRYDLLRASESLRLSKNPGALTAEVQSLPPKSWVIIDEIQKAPLLLDEVHFLMEERKIRFVLSGSSARKLKREGANLLAGRARVLRLFPFTSHELSDASGDFALPSLDRILEFGLLPGTFSPDGGDDKMGCREFLKAYAETYLEEEIKAEALTRNIGGFARFLEIAARQNGQITQVTNISKDAGVARQTVQGFFDVLVDTLIGFWLPAWKLKRSTKQIAHPKFFFFDPGVARVLSERSPYPVMPEERGFLFETFILHEIRAFLAYQKLDYPLYFWSSHDSVEVDLLLETRKGFLAFEMKSIPRWEKKFNSGLLRIQKELRLKHHELIGIYSGERPLSVSEGIKVLPVFEFLKRLWAGEIIS